MQDHAVKSFSSRALNGALLAVGWLGSTAAPALAQTKNPDREAYFGETHVHTSWSLDAWLFGNRITDPGDAYKYFKGEPIKHPLGYEVKIDTPLDWAGVTDHSEYVGVIRLANDPKLADQQAARRPAPDHEGRYARPRSSESSCTASGF